MLVADGRGEAASPQEKTIFRLAKLTLTYGPTNHEIHDRPFAGAGILFAQHAIDSGLDCTKVEPQPEINVRLLENTSIDGQPFKRSIAKKRDDTATVNQTNKRFFQTYLPSYRLQADRPTREET